MLIGLVLIQQGKGADMGAAFGGGSNTLFGASGATAFITKLTTGIAVAFMVTSILLINLYTAHTRSGGGVFSGKDAVQKMLDNNQPPAAASAPAAEAPVAPAQPAAAPAPAEAGK
jgi:preprotein translocase subunit SecG